MAAASCPRPYAAPTHHSPLTQYYLLTRRPAATTSLGRKPSFEGLRMSLPLANRMADYACQLRFEDLPTPVVHEVKRRLIDSFATAVGAMDADAFAIARRCASRVQGKPGASLLGGGTSSGEWATFVNGLLIRYLDYNDTYLSLEPAHPSDNLAPVLAVGEMAGAKGPDLIVAATLAYEIQCRLCDAASLRKHGFDHVTYGAISSCVAAGKPLR